MEGSQFTSNLAQELRFVLGFGNVVVIPYHPQANSLDECDHDSSALFGIQKRIKSEWIHFLPLAQRILNYSVDVSIGTQPARELFGEISIFRYSHGLAFGMGNSSFAKVPLQAS